ncbi:hypothetical protein B0T24DRAFT_712123 [Lasiosphaeria ovina]|uniref:Uncharacterized protein n=1 Tax=Lasiosphaeria ovina TaxID=92902 RepID=A0AAE0JVN4_9PEZI|nr:hypothetical protein B0T24DRAFT_712123 [Lasiosphaeria ovina]
MATRCFSPPLSTRPRSPTLQKSESGNGGLCRTKPQTPLRLWETRTGAIQRSYNHGSPANDELANNTGNDVVKSGSTCILRSDPIPRIVIAKTAEVVGGAKDGEHDGLAAQFRFRAVGHDLGTHRNVFPRIGLGHGDACVMGRAGAAPCCSSSDDAGSGSCSRSCLCSFDVDKNGEQPGFGRVP